MNNRPPIPNEMKRAVRQRCGFGCVICGFPLYEYEHMEEWAVVQRHVEEEITLLCRMHHGMKTDGLLPVKDVKAANKDPYNKKVGVSKNILMSYSGQDVALHLGSSLFEQNGLKDGSFFAPLVVDGLPMVGFRLDQGRLFLNFIAFDETNKLILQILDNELVYDTNQWDIAWVAQELTIREGQGKILLQLRFEPPGVIRLVKGRILRNGIELLVGKDYLFNTNNAGFFANIHVKNFQIGFAIGDPTPNSGGAFVISGINRYAFDKTEALRFLRKSLNISRSIRKSTEQQ